MSSFVWFKLPQEKTFYKLKQTQGQPQALLSPLQLEGESGFVFAPFYTTLTQPLFVIQANELTQHTLEGSLHGAMDYNKQIKSGNKDSYLSVFSTFHEALIKQTFAKLVLSRCETHEASLSLDEQKKFFMRACATYPHLFVALIHIPQAGSWLMATPETLLQETNTEWKTMALAATQKVEKTLSQSELKQIVWGEKEVHEQQIVADYIANSLAKANIEHHCTKPYTTQAAHLLHLRTDFSFNIQTQKQLVSLINSLHPTPAVCGIPKQNALEFILANEAYNRKYYSGFAGLFNLEGFYTHLFVTLRCMEMKEKTVAFYAGGGLLLQSDEEKEWQETQNKMQTMKKLFY